MNFFNDLKVSKKLGLFTMVALISLIAVGAIGYYYLQESNYQMNILYEERLIPNDEISEILQVIETIKNNIAIHETILSINI